jgi:hypothetical protein
MTQLALDFQSADAPSSHWEGVFLVLKNASTRRARDSADASSCNGMGLCPDCTFHLLIWGRGMWRCPGCNP